MSRRSKRIKLSNSGASIASILASIQDTKHLILDDESIVICEIPWEYNKTRKTVETVKILRSSNIRSIPFYAFRGFTSLQSVRIEDGAIVTEIGAHVLFNIVGYYNQSDLRMVWKILE